MLDMDLVLIFSFVLTITCVSFFFGNAIHKRNIEREERKEALERERADRNPSASNERFKKLEDRVRVLERLATDRGATLADEIEALRDERAEFSDSGMPLPVEREKEAS